MLRYVHVSISRTSSGSARKISEETEEMSVRRK